MPQARGASLLGRRAEVHLEKSRSFSRSGGQRGGAVDVLPAAVTVSADRPKGVFFGPRSSADSPLASFPPSDPKLFQSFIDDREIERLGIEFVAGPAAQFSVGFWDWQGLRAIGQKARWSGRADRSVITIAINWLESPHAHDCHVSMASTR